MKPIAEIPLYKKTDDPPGSDVSTNARSSDPSLTCIGNMTRERTNLYLSLCELLSTFALQHHFHRWTPTPDTEMPFRPVRLLVSLLATAASFSRHVRSEVVLLWELFR